MTKISHKPHILIVGAGLIGLSSAHSLAKRGAYVTVIERRSGPAMGASFSNSGMRHPSQASPWMLPRQYFGHYKPAAYAQSRAALTASVLDLAQISKPLIAEKMKRFGMKTVTPKGCYKLYSSRDEAKRALNQYKADGVDCAAVPVASRPFRKASLFFPQDGFGDAYAYCRALEAELRASGAVNFIYNAENVQLEKRGLSVRGIQCNGDRFEADHILVAAGSESAALLRPLGLDMPVYPVTGYALNFARTAQFEALDLPQVPIMDAASHSALSFYEDHIRLSGTVGAKSAKALLSTWGEISPELMKALGDPIRVWEGQRPMSALGRPFIGRTAIPRLWVNCGHGHMGWTLSAGSGEVLAEMVMEDVIDARFVW